MGGYPGCPTRRRWWIDAGFRLAKLGGLYRTLWLWNMAIEIVDLPIKKW